MSEEQTLISVFADGRVWIAVDVLHRLLDADALKGQPGVYVHAALKETIKYIEEQTIVSISDRMFDSLEEE